MAKKRKIKKDYTGFMLPKGETSQGMTDVERDRAFKIAYMYIWHCLTGWSYETMDFMDLHHIKSKGAFPELRYKFSNCVLLTREEHTITHSGFTNPVYSMLDRFRQEFDLLKSCEF